MKAAAIGVRVHSGWGALVAVAGGCSARDAIEIIERRRVEVIDPKMPGTKQPYHFVRECEVPQAQAHLTECRELAERLASQSIRAIIREMRGIGYQIEASAILLASGRKLPSLPEILASHPMLHTAEGVFFREAFRKGCKCANLRLAAIRERELANLALDAFGKRAASVRHQIERAGKTLGPPWTSDQKLAALAAIVALHDKRVH